MTFWTTWTKHKDCQCAINPSPFILGPSGPSMKLYITYIRDCKDTLTDCGGSCNTSFSYRDGAAQWCLRGHNPITVCFLCLSSGLAHQCEMYSPCDKRTYGCCGINPRLQWNTCPQIYTQTKLIVRCKQCVIDFLLLTGLVLENSFIVMWLSNGV